MDGRPSGLFSFVVPGAHDINQSLNPNPIPPQSKGFNPQEQDVHIILAIHNAVNEQGWTQVLDWEKRYGGCS